jgi:hypothetical protein
MEIGFITMGSVSENGGRPGKCNRINWRAVGGALSVVPDMTLARPTPLGALLPQVRPQRSRGLVVPQRPGIVRFLQRSLSFFGTSRNKFGRRHARTLWCFALSLARRNFRSNRERANGSAMASQAIDVAATSGAAYGAAIVEMRERTRGLLRLGFRRGVSRPIGFYREGALSTVVDNRISVRI